MTKTQFFLITLLTQPPQTLTLSKTKKASYFQSLFGTQKPKETKANLPRVVRKKKKPLSNYRDSVADFLENSNGKLREHRDQYENGGELEVYGETPIFQIIRENNIDALNFLLARETSLGKNVLDVQNNDKESPLLVAVKIFFII